MLHFVWFDNYLPRIGSKPGFYDETVINYVGAKARCALQHQAQIDLGEGTILHPLFHMRGQLKLPVPPVGKRHPSNLPHVVAGSRLAPEARSLPPHCPNLAQLHSTHVDSLAPAERAIRSISSQISNPRQPRYGLCDSR